MRCVPDVCVHFVLQKHKHNRDAVQVRQVAADDEGAAVLLMAFAHHQQVALRTCTRRIWHSKDAVEVLEIGSVNGSETREQVAVTVVE